MSGLKNYLNTAFYFFILLLSICTLYVGFNHFTYEGLSKLLFQSDYYINYKAGFVRRGLDGQIIYSISEYFNVNAILLQKAYNLFFFIIFLFLTISFIIKNKPPLYLIFSFSVLLLYFIYITNDLRKDHIMIVYFFFLVMVLKKEITFYKKTIIINGIFIIGILSHEIFYLISIIPTLFILSGLSFKKVIQVKNKILGMLFFPTLLFITISIFFKGNWLTGKTIIESWQHLGVQKLAFNGGIFNGTFYFWKILSPFQTAGLIITLWLHFIFIFTSLKNHFVNKKDGYKFLLFQYAVCILLCSVAIDYSRWVFLFNMTFLITIYSGKHVKITGIHWFPSLKISLIVLYFFIGMPYSRWTVKSWFLSTPAGTTLKLIKDKVSF